MIKPMSSSMGNIRIFIAVIDLCLANIKTSTTFIYR